ncbi:hypothetical protein [Christiangramia sediminis]|uniref:Uncharacterized protein n=1 Tax=Christiangramia sediminis TaxID=2881336 RepID=A0A9X1RXG8_9FLAO|nr:hypothetical protein [Christiangramia sediminis]MCB7481042.1 hypothetical protein [Christiangramia sediminis]
MMEVSIILAKFWGWYLLIFFTTLSVRPSRIKQIFEDLKDQKFVIIASFLATVIGLVNILLHNSWESNWTIIITLIGWTSLILGIVLFAFQQMATNFLLEVNIKLVQVLYMLLFILGLYLLNMGYQLILY